jgi:hypothetical protein
MTDFAYILSGFLVGAILTMILSPFFESEREYKCEHLKDLLDKYKEENMRLKLENEYLIKEKESTVITHIHYNNGFKNDNNINNPYYDVVSNLKTDNSTD